MIYFTGKKIPLTLPDAEATIKSRINQKYDITQKGDAWLISRKRILGNRGSLRLLFPMIVTKVTFKDGHVHYKSRPDGVAFLFLIVTLGAVATELFMDRVEYPREYPAAFPFGLFAWFFLFLIFEAIRTSKLIKDCVTISK